MQILRVYSPQQPTALVQCSTASIRRCVWSVAAGGKLLGRMRPKLSRLVPEALGKLAAAPNNENNQANPRKQLAKALGADPALKAAVAA